MKNACNLSYFSIFEIFNFLKIRNSEIMRLSEGWEYRRMRTGANITQKSLSDSLQLELQAIVSH